MPGNLTKGESMQGNDGEQFHQDLWKSQEEGQTQMTSDEVRAKASRYERESVLRW
jgi:hypothetical protein